MDPSAKIEGSNELGKKDCLINVRLLNAIVL